MKRIGLFRMAIIILLSIVSIPVFSQFILTAMVDGVSIDSVHMCIGDSLDLSSNGSANFLMNNNFNNHQLGTGWSSTAANPTFNNPCQCVPLNTCTSYINGCPGAVGPNSAFAWVGTTASQTRTLETNSYQLLQFSLGGRKVEWWMMYGSCHDNNACEDPDELDEGVHLQYSVNNGATWADFPGPNVNPVGNTSATGPFNTTIPGSGGYWTPLSYNSQQIISPLYNWNKYSVMVPSNAYTNTTKFRWAQLATSSTGYDAWGIDEVEISCPTVPFVEWRHIGCGQDSIFWSGMGNTALDPPPFQIFCPGLHLYIVTLVDLNTGNSVSDTVKVIVHNPIIDAGINKSICFGDSIMLNSSVISGGTLSNYIWNNSIHGQSIMVSPPFTTQYIVDAEDNIGCRTKDSLIVTVNPLPIVHVTNDSVCIGEMAILNVTGGSTYLWSNNQTTASISVSPSVTTIYQVIAYTNYNCKDTAEAAAVIFPKPSVTITSDTTICSGTSANLTVNGGVDYYWSISGNTATIQVAPLISTNYNVTVTDTNNCSKDTSVYVTVIPSPVASAYVGQDTICLGMNAVLSAQGGTNYLWNNGSTSSSQSIIPTATTTYSVVVFNTQNGVECSDTAYITQYARNCNMVYFPNAIVPYGYNTIFKPIGEIINAKDYYLAIYNRWGEKLFETTDPEMGWDGRFMGEFVQPGVYIYYFKMGVRVGEIYEKTGTIAVMR